MNANFQKKAPFQSLRTSYQIPHGSRRSLVTDFLRFSVTQMKSDTLCRLFVCYLAFITRCNGTLRKHSQTHRLCLIACWKICRVQTGNEKFPCSSARKWGVNEINSNNIAFVWKIVYFYEGNLGL